MAFRQQQFGYDLCPFSADCWPNAIPALFDSYCAQLGRGHIKCFRLICHPITLITPSLIAHCDCVWPWSFSFGNIFFYLLCHNWRGSSPVQPWALFCGNIPTILLLTLSWFMVAFNFLWRMKNFEGYVWVFKFNPSLVVSLGIWTYSNVHANNNIWATIEQSKQLKPWWHWEILNFFYMMSNSIFNTVNSYTLRSV